MNMEQILAERIEILESIIDHLPLEGRSRREYYREKCEIYRHILADITHQPRQEDRDRPRTSH